MKYVEKQLRAEHHDDQPGVAIWSMGGASLGNQGSRYGR